MIKYLLKHILKTISLILTIIFINILINIGLFSYIAIDSKYNDDTDPISLGKDIVKGRDLKSWNDYLKEKDIWAFVLDSNGEIIDSSNLPKNIKSSYDLRDIAKFTRYYLEDYPVFTFVKDEGLLVLGYPKGSYDKLPFNYINMKLFPRIIYFIILILVLNIVGLIFIYIKIRKKIYDDIIPIQKGIDSLSKNEDIELSIEGELKELKEAVNKSSKKMNELTNSRNRWIRGISHDIRTDLAKIVWTVEAMPEDMNTAKIRRHAEDISNTINNMNLNIALDSESQINIEEIMIIAFIRKIVTEYANRNPEYEFEFNYNFKENELFRMDMHLIKRAIENILINAIEHNDPCKIMIDLNRTEDFLIIEISDDGGEIEPEIIHKLNTKFDLNYDNIGLGTNVVKQIIKIHSGSVKFLSEGGLKVQIKLPQKKS